jgi:ATP adenylyltransferase
MDRVWAGWRAEYLADVVEGDDSGLGSVFRAILDSGRPDEQTHIVWRGERVFAILNRFPYTSGHVLVMPYREVADLEALSTEESSELWAAVTHCVQALKTAYRPQGINIGVNLGLAGGAGVPSHIHVHVVPRWHGDTSFMTSAAEARVLPEALDVTWEKLRAAWPPA